MTTLAARSQQHNRDTNVAQDLLSRAPEHGPLHANTAVRMTSIETSAKLHSARISPTSELALPKKVG
jgi:hypothetical protein